jgi:hypothetical protein
VKPGRFGGSFPLCRHTSEGYRRGRLALLCHASKVDVSTMLCKKANQIQINVSEPAKNPIFVG